MDSADFLVLQFALDDGELWPIAVVLLDAEDKLHLCARTDLRSRLHAADARVLKLFLNDVIADAQHRSGQLLLATLEDRLSNAVRITDRKRIQAPSLERALQEQASKYLL